MLWAALIDKFRTFRRHEWSLRGKSRSPRPMKQGRPALRPSPRGWNSKTACPRVHLRLSESCTCRISSGGCLNDARCPIPVLLWITPVTKTLPLIWWSRGATDSVLRIISRPTQPSVTMALHADGFSSSPVRDGPLIHVA